MRRSASLLCSIEGCGRPCHGGSALCVTHKVRRMLGRPLEAPILRHECDPNRMIRAALDRWYEDLARRRQRLDEQRAQLDEMLSGGSALAQIRWAQAAVAEADVNDDNEWRRANERLRQALVRYAQRRQRTPKHKMQARRRR